MIAYQDEIYSLYPQSGSGIIQHDDQEVINGVEHTESRVIVETPQGFVKAYASKYARNHSSSMLEIIKDGKIHVRRFNKYYRPRYLVTLAKRFAKEVFS